MIVPGSDGESKPPQVFNHFSQNIAMNGWNTTRGMKVEDYVQFEWVTCKPSLELY